MRDILAQAVELLLCTKVLNDLESVEGELVVEQPVAEPHREDNADDVHELAEAKPHVILGIPEQRIEHEDLAWFNEWCDELV